MAWTVESYVVIKLCSPDDKLHLALLSVKCWLRIIFLLSSVVINQCRALPAAVEQLQLFDVSI